MYYDVQVLGFVTPPTTELRTPMPSVKPRRKWISGADEKREEDGAGADLLANSPEAVSQDVVCYRLSVASVGCGIIAVCVDCFGYSPDAIFLKRESPACGLLQDMLQHSSSLIKLRLNNCQITDAGAILLASGIRVCILLLLAQIVHIVVGCGADQWCPQLTTTLQLLDVSNEESVYRKEESMDNEIGDNGARAIALALEQNQSIKQVHLQ